MQTAGSQKAPASANSCHAAIDQGLDCGQPRRSIRIAPLAAWSATAGTVTKASAISVSRRTERSAPMSPARIALRYPNQQKYVIPKPVPKRIAAPRMWAVFQSSNAVIREAYPSNRTGARPVIPRTAQGVLAAEQRDALVVLGLGQRLQPGVDIGEVGVGEDRALVGRHPAAGVAHEGR